MIVARVRRTIEERGLIARGTRVLAACSGGLDSAAMLVALARLAPQLGFELEAASVDHGLRAGAGRDLEIARDQAASVGVAFHALRVNVARGASLQAAARSARYAALHEQAQRSGAARIATAHSRDDQAETVLMRMLRGAGASGLSGIDPQRDDGVIRPVIDCSRHDLHAFAAKNCPQVALDPSNGDLRFERVRLRSTLAPLLAAEDPAWVDHLCDLADDARALRAALLPLARQLLKQCLQETGIIRVSQWASAPEAVRRTALRVWLEPVVGADLGRAHIEQLDRAALGRGEVWLPLGYVARSRGDGVLSLISPESARGAGPK